ncbi:MAG TPA: trypsin-like peptidase domain-containing protein [Polyangiaceae bacterium]|nr:trypsin-like peptidase domain-containing protein [Polyangiaceae bacterium]
MRARRLASVLAITAVACGGAPRGHSDRVSARHPPPATRSLSPADIASRALPSVVTIRTAQSLGTGFIVRQDGWIATNLHVIVGGPHVSVTLRTERELDVVEVLAASPEHDLALVRVEARGLPSIALGDSDAMRPGDAVVAIGNPMGLEDTVSNGLVSARRTGEDGTEVLQISAPIAPGSSGGPIFNDRGEVIGVATAVLLGGQNINFGVPVRYLAPMIREPSPMPFARFANLMQQMRNAAREHGDGKKGRYPASILDGCNADAQKLIAQMADDAIDDADPFCDEGRPDACYHAYDGSASDLARRLPPACRGPVKAIADAQRKAAALGNADARASVLRDTFDGLRRAVARKADFRKPPRP